MSDLIDVQAILRRAVVKELAPAPTPASRSPAANSLSDNSRPSKAEDTFGISDGIVNTNQLRAARTLLGWGQATLARHAGVSVPTIKRIEGGAGKPLKFHAFQGDRRACRRWHRAHRGRHRRRWRAAAAAVTAPSAFRL